MHFDIYYINKDIQMLSKNRYNVASNLQLDGQNVQNN